MDDTNPSEKRVSDDTPPVRIAYPLAEAAKLMGLPTGDVERMADDRQIATIRADGAPVRVELVEIVRVLAADRVPRDGEEQP